jgi:hypothetical protein
LRERLEDIPTLADYFLDKYKQKYHKPDLVLNEVLISELTIILGRETSANSTIASRSVILAKKS